MAKSMILKQFDSSNSKLEDFNLIQSFSSDYDLIFNESFFVVGDKLEAHKIHACYDLTIYVISL